MTTPTHYADPNPGGDMSEEEMAHLEAGELKELGDWKPNSKELALMITLAVISLMVALDATILVSVLPTLALDLGGSANDAFWAGTSYLLACAVCQPFLAALSDIFGRKEILLTSVLLFTLGTALCAPIAKDFAVFFVGRAVQGIGGGGIITMGQVIFADVVPLRQRPKYFSIVLAAWALGSVLGPVVGGLFVEHAHWGWCFYINFPFCVLGLVLIPIYVKLKTDKTSLMAKLARVDWVGAFLFTAGTTSFLIGISWGGIQYAWRSAQVLTPIIMGIFGVVLCVLWEKYAAQEPILRPSLFSSGSAIFLYICALFQGLILFSALYYVPFYFTAVRFDSPTQSGLDIFPVTCFLLPGSIVISILTTRTGRFRWAIWVGWAISALGCGLLVLFDEVTPTPVWAVVLSIFGIGMGMLLTSINVGIQATSSAQDAGRAAAMYAFMRTLGMSIGVAIGGTTFQNVMIQKLHELGLPESIAHDAEAYAMEMAQMDPTDIIRIGSLQAYVHGFHGVYWVVTGVSIVGFVISFGIKRHSMNKRIESKFILRGSVARMPLVTSSSTNIAVKSLSSSRRTTGMSTPSEAYQGTATPNFVSEGDGGSGHAQPRSSTTSPADVEAATADVAAVVYYIEPGGKVTPVNICHAPSSSLSSYSTVNSDRPLQEYPESAMLHPGIVITSEERGEGSSSSASGGMPPQLQHRSQSFSTPGAYENRPPIEYQEAGFQESALRPEQRAVHRMSAMYDWHDPDSPPARELLSQYSYWSGSVQSDVTRPGSAAAESRPGTRLGVVVNEVVGRRSWS